ncbi:MAG: right-handed parallel beta-helix repeat-containing protein [Fimbriimonadales bacterium]
MRFGLLAGFVFAVCSLASGQTVRVRDLGSLRAAVAQAKPGARILIEPGDYAGLYMTDLHGTASAPIVIGGADPANPPHFVAPIQFQSVSYIEFRDFAIVGASGNAIGVDDGGKRESPAHHITLRNLQIADVPGGGSNGIKLAGVDDFRIERCTVERWGGCAVDMVGCHRGVIESCRFEKGGGVGVQAKGASADVTVRRCAFADYGGRGVNIGGSTGIPYFRPPLEKVPPGSRYEAKDIVVEGCTFLRGGAPVAFAGADGATVRFNTIVDPEHWALRILQETSTPDFVPSRKGVFEDNLVVFRSAGWAEGGVNIGPGTAPQTFRFIRNWWFCSDRPDRSKPTLPTAEQGGVVGRDPQLRDPEHGDVGVNPGSPASKVGAHALPAT